MTRLFVLLVVFQFKHFLADFPLQTEWMLGKFRDRGWVAPLAAHAGVHAAFTFAIAAAVGARWPLLPALFDLSAHFAMDRIKASPAMLGRFKPLTAATYASATAEQKRGNRLFWWSLGLDQMVHHLTHYAIVAWLALT